MGKDTLTLHAPAKINLGLRVLNRRSDGYHDIETIMVKLDLTDVVHLRPHTDGIHLDCPGTQLPVDTGNLAFKAAAAFFAHTECTPGISITLEKNIPVAAGLGGGSSDAAAVLTGLNFLFGTRLSEPQLCAIGQTLGADVPFFVAGCTAALATGIGEKLQALTLTDPFWCVLVNPGFSVSTRWVYENLTLTTTTNPFMLGRSWQTGYTLSPFSSIDNSLFVNDLESVTAEKHPVIDEIKLLLLRQGATLALMSGSGPTVFGIFRNESDAGEAAALVRREFNFKVFVTALLHRYP